jgi:3-oxoadipate enol-lactonase
VNFIMPSAKLPDAQIYYEWAGHEGLPVLVFSNSLGTNLHMWDPQVEEFARYFRVLRYDTRGHGQSSITPGPYTIEQLGQDVVRLLDTLQVERAHLCGLSMGGTTGMFLGSTSPHRFQKIVLCNTSPKFGTPETWNARIQTVQNGGMKAVADAVIERWFTSAFRSSHPKEAQVLLAMLESASPQGYVANCAAVRDADMRQVLSKIRVPCLVLAGTHDPSATPADGHFLAENIPGARYVELVSAHISNVEAHEDFNRHVLQFLLA